MTLATLITGIKVKFMAEERIGFKWNIFYSVTPGAATGNAEGSFAVMTSATGKPALHLFHGYMGVGTIGLEELDMTICAAKESKVEFVTEHHCPEIGNFYRDLLCHMTGAALGKRKSPNLVMAQTAGFTLLHLSHCNGRILFTDFKKHIMAEGAVVP